MILSKSVPRLSRLRYVLRVIEDHQMPGTVSESDIIKSVQSEGLKIEMERAKYTALRVNIVKSSEAYESRLRRQAKETIRLMKRWNILRPTKTRGEYSFAESETVRTIIGSVSTNPSLAQESLYWQAVKSGERLLFPGYYIMTLRNSQVDQEYGTIRREAFPSTLAKSLKVESPPNQVTMDVILTWMDFFGFSAYLDEEGIVVCTKAIASLNELWKLHSFLGKHPERTDLLQRFAAFTNLNPFAAQSVLECASAGGLLNERESKISNVDEMLVTLKENAILLHQTDDRVDSLKNIDSLRDPQVQASTYMYADFHLSRDLLYSEVYNQYRRSIQSPNDYAWTSSVRAAICRRLHIHPSTFDEFLEELIVKYGPSLIEIGEIYSDTLGKRKIQEVVIVHGQPIFKFRLRRERL